jgi:hypothetical protein
MTLNQLQVSKQENAELEEKCDMLLEEMERLMQE